MASADDFIPGEDEQERSSLTAYVNPPFGGMDEIEKAGQLVRHYLENRGFDPGRIDPIPGMGASAGGIELGVLFKAATLVLKCTKAVVEISQLVKARRNRWIIDEHRMNGLAHMTYAADPGAHPLGLLVQLEGLDDEWQAVFPGTHLDLVLNLSNSRGMPRSGEKSAIVNLRASEVSAPVVAEILRHFGKQNSGNMFYRMHGGKIIGVRRLRKEISPRDPSHKFWKSNLRKQMMWDRV